MKVYVSRVPQRGPWGGGNRWLIALFAALQRYQISVVSSPAMADVIVAAGVDDASPIELGIIKLAEYAVKNKKPLLFRVNDCDARKNTKHINESILIGSTHATKIVYVSNWLRDHLDPAKKFQHKTTVIVNGVDHDIFRPMRHNSQSDRLRIVTHHWSDNKLKGAAWYEHIDKMTLTQNISFTYIGRHKCSFVGKTVSIPPIDGEQLAKMLAAHDLYVSGSLYDPGPNHIIEAVSCELPAVVSADGGGCAEFSQSANVVKNEAELEALILNRSFHVSDRKFSSWEFCADLYVNEIKNIC